VLAGREDQVDKKTLKRIRDLHALMGSSNAEERERAREKLEALLRKHGKTWNDLPELLQQEQGSAGPSHDPRDDVPASAGSGVKALDVVHHLLQAYVEMKPHEYIDRFTHSPRLALLSPVRGCGKTVLLDVLSNLVPRPHKTDNITAAGIYYQVHTSQSTMLVDEADNLEFAARGALIATLNSGYRKGRRITRFKFSYRTWAPMAIAGINTLPMPTMSRCIVINMARATRELRRYNEDDLQELHIAYSMARSWAQGVTLNSDPKLPEVLRNRPADNWRSLISIADTFGPAWGDKAREAAIEFSKGYHDEDIGVLLLRDIRKVFFEKFPAILTSFPSAYLVACLNTFEGAPWSEWCGVHGNQTPRRLSQGELAKLLRPFRIRPKTVWWPDRQGTSMRGYYRADFEDAWRSYCDEANTPTQQPTNVRHLHSARGGRS
jgi:Protein of unknown function (DUF3631)